MAPSPRSPDAAGASADPTRAEPAANAPGILYFDPNPTTARLTTAGLRLSGYNVYHAASEEDAVAFTRTRGPGGDGSIHALVLDTATAPEVSATVLRALVQVPGAAELPGILLVSRTNPEPIPGAESLPTLRRPFTTPALLALLREAIESPPQPPSSAIQTIPPPMVDRLRLVFAEIFPELDPEPARLQMFAAALVSEADLPAPFVGKALLGHLSAARLDAVLSMLDASGARGVLHVEDGPTVVRLHLDRGRVRLAEAEGVEEDLRLGRFVVEAGYLTLVQVEMVAKSDDPKRRPLGQRLVEDQHLRPDDLARVLLDQAREVTCHLLDWTEGVYAFTPSDTLHPLAETGIAARNELRIAEVLLEGMRRVAERAEMGPDMPGVDDVFLRNDEAVARAGRAAFTREELGVLELINGRNAVKDVARKSRAGAFAVTKVLHRLWRAGLVSRRTAPVQA